MSGTLDKIFQPCDWDDHAEECAEITDALSQYYDDLKEIKARLIMRVEMAVGNLPAQKREDLKSDAGIPDPRFPARKMPTHTEVRIAMIHAKRLASMSAEVAA